MTDQATPPVSPVQSTAALQQNASYPVLESCSVSELHETGQIAIPAPKKVKAPPFTPQSARIAALKSWEARRKAKEPPPSPAQLAPVAISAGGNPELELVQEQIAHTRTVLNDRDFRYCEHCRRSGLEPQHRAQLLKALDALLDRKRILSGDPLPGSRRPAPETQRSRSSSFLAPADLPPATPQEGQAQEQE